MSGRRRVAEPRARSIRVPRDRGILPPLLGLIERAVFEAADADRRAVRQRVLALRQVIDVAVETVGAHECALILDQLFQIGTPAHPTYDRPPYPDMLDFARTGAAVGGTSATLEKTRLLADYFRTLDDEDLRRAAVFMSGRPFGPSQRRTLGLGWAAVSKVIGAISGRVDDELQRLFRKHSDLGDWAGEALDGRTQNEDVPLAEVEKTLEAIRTARGASKAAPLEQLLRRLHPEAARFAVKVISSEMRIGLSEGLVEAAIAEAFGLPVTKVRRVHLITGDIGETAVRVKQGKVETSTVTLFQPVRFMLASPVETAAEAFERMGADKVWTEEKYDGVRCQLHYYADGRVELFSRDLKQTTAAFPELAESATKLGHAVLFDGEVLAHRDGRVLRFFELQHRLGRKKVTDELRREVPVVLVIFDLLHLDGRSLLDEPLEEWRRLLECLRIEHPFLLARLEEATSPADLDRIFVDTRERGHEGLMAKDPSSPYTPGRRGLAWLKLKRPLATLDVVVTSVEWGHGKRKGVLSDYTFAVKDMATGRLDRKSTRLNSSHGS